MGRNKNRCNWEVIEELLEENMVCINDGRGTRIDVRTGNTSVLDLTLVSRNLAGICEWDVAEETSIGSDHFRVLCSILLQRNREQGEIFGKWENSSKWEMFKYICEREMEEINLNEDVKIDKKFKSHNYHNKCC